MLIKKTEEFKKYFPVNLKFEFSDIEPFVETAEDKYIKHLLGDEQWDEIQEYYDDNIDTIPEFNVLIKKLQKPISYFALLRGLSSLNLKLTASGFVVNETSGHAPASKHRTDELKVDLSKDAYDAVEELLRFLEKNIDDYPNWEESDAYQEHYQFFIRNATEFDKEVRIDESRLKFINMRPVMRNMQKLHIVPVISEALANQILLEIKTNTLTVANSLLFEPIKSALANYTAGREIDPLYTEFGVTFLSEVKKILYKTPDNYPLFKASDSYVEDITIEPIEQDLEAGFFGMG